jgi:opacity protein-like surface antigen
MKLVVLPSAALIAAAFSIPSFAQNPANPTSPMTTPVRAPWYGGLSVGRAELDNACFSGFSCDDKDTTFRAFAGTRFNNIIGVEVGALNIGKYSRGGGETDGWGADLAATAGIPIGANSSVFGKLGAIYARTEVGGTAPGLQSGKERGFGPRWGVGAQVGLTPNWAVRLDWDRFRIPFPGQKEDLDTLMLGAQYTFR